MAFGAEAGQGHIALIPSMKGFRSAVSKEVKASGQEGGNWFSKAFNANRTGSKLGGDLNKGFKASSQGMSDAVLKPFQQQVGKASQAYAAALLKQKDAALNTAAAQGKLTTAIAQHGEGSIQAEKASLRLEQAQLKEQAAAEGARAASERLAAAKERLAAVESAAAKSSGSAAGAFRTQMSMFKAGFSSIERGKSSFTGMSGAIGSLARSILGLDVIQPLGSKIAGIAKGGLQTFTGFASQIGVKVSTGLQGAVRATQSTLGGWGRNIASWGSGIGGKVGGVMSGIAQKLPGPFRAAGSAIGGYFSNITASVGGVFGKLSGAVGGALGTLASGAASVASAIGSKFAATAHAIGDNLKTAAAAGMAALATGAAALGAKLIGVGKSAFAAYSTYEQAVGGIDTLFKGASQTVQNFAKQAYKTAGVSANEYMAQITSFSASLIGSLGGDTAKAAQAGNMAMVDMSDNANKLGTDIGDIQHAYQGFAKQNYTMLDNLKLGYGGTKTEMQRLIGDANKVKKAHGEMADLSVDKFSDVVEAIHLIQGQLGVTGTTAREASTTIEGSVGSMKAAYANWLTELGKDNADVPGLTDQLAQSIGTALSNILPRISVIAKSIVNAIPSMFGGLVTLLPEPFQQAVSSVGGIFDRFKPLLASLGGGFAALGMGGLAPLLSKIPLLGGMLGRLAGPLKFLGGPIGILVAAIGGLIATSPKLQEIFGAQLTTTMAAIGNAISRTIPMIELLVNTLSGQLGRVMPSITDAVGGLIPVVGAALDALTPMIPAIITPLVQAIQLLLPPLANIVTGLLPPLTDLIIQLLPPITQIIGVIVQVAGTIMSALIPIVQGIAPLIGQIVQIIAMLIVSLTPLISQIAAMVANMVAAITPILNFIVQLVAGVIAQIVGFIQQVIIPTIRGLIPVVQSAIGAVGAILHGIAQIVQGVIDIIAGIFSGDWKRVWNGIGGVVSGAVNAISGLLGGMKDVGVNLVKGLWNGISSLGGWILDKIKGFGSGIVDKFKGIFGIHSPSKVMRGQIGVMLGKGLALGVDDSRGDVMKSMQRMTSIIPDKISMGVNASANPANLQDPNGDAGAAGAGKTIVVDTKIDARGTPPETVLAMWGARSRAAAERIGG
jgi:phage-related protein